tara:strand:- start:7336 stop:8481 length:1146 start_codon:yes stop_codon:yes gene_type:complete
MGHNSEFAIKAGRVFCSETGINGSGSVLIKGNKIESAGPDLKINSSTSIIDFPNCLIIPGLIDMHAHPSPSNWKYGMDPDMEVLPRGTTTILSQGDAGAKVWDQYLEDVIFASETRILMAISLSVQGESEHRPALGCLEDIDTNRCVNTILRGGAHIWGISINLNPGVTGTNDPKQIMSKSLDTAERTGKPLLFGARIETDEWPLGDQLDMLRPNDVVTYCFRNNKQSIVNDGHVIDAAWRARDRGVLFDIGHGMASFDFSIAEAAISEDFIPDTISTDFYKRHINSSPRHDLPRTMSKLLAAGMHETDVFERVTSRPAQAIGMRGKIGTLASGSCADLAVLQWNTTDEPLVDVSGNSRQGGYWEPVATVRNGKLIYTDKH